MSLVHLFNSEIEQIQDNRIREFVVDALDKLPDFYENNSEFIEQTKKAFEYSKNLLEVLGADDYASDVVKSSILLQDYTRYYEDTDEVGNYLIKDDPIHPLSARMKLMPLLGIIGEDKFEDILRTIESSHGLNSPIPQVMPSISDPVYIWILPIANSLARALKTE
jgi:hypothetical protein